ncbi:RagB/SusD family nutrient uptake outer membrane protein [Chryseobacterium indologenes]|uniref:RagB/SusD family nutrient uptake outer membrane protein n=1 Tax=Chryseobacterium indologenes TaxID=253 RepID=UPI0023E7CD38|nr:RagB/SusD family nutrient uptake outer membrane protein [Chryseobacterium indologenes]WET48403.1 RagB/SusD family nutrient uptake outer membrane protein [Chryseobacterium indologenes]
MKNKILKVALLSIGLLTVSVSCSDDFVEREFFQEVEQAPLKSVQEMQSFVRGTYDAMRSQYYYGCDFLAYGEVRSDVMFSNLNSGYYTNVMNYTQVSADSYAKDTWNFIYKSVAKANVVINTDYSSFKESDKDQAAFLQGQAYAVRALNFFDLLRLYGQQYTGTGNLGVVLPLKYDPKAMQARSTIAETEAQIAADFDKAVQLMNDHSSYDKKSGDRTALSLSAVKGLMARFYLYKSDYAKVRQLVNQIVAAGGYSVVSASDFANSYDFSKNGSSPNSMFELAVGNVSALGTASYRHKLSNGGYSNLVLKAGVPDALYGPTNTDVRKSLITTASNGTIFLSYLLPNGSTKGKYMNASGADNIKMLRYEEVLLDGVEAELNGGDLTKALTYYNQIRTNRNLPAAGSVAIADLKAERARELLGEGLRQWDLRRWGDAVPRPTGASTSALLNAFPIPLSETNVGAVQSNPGYDN